MTASHDTGSGQHPSRLQLVTAFAAIYLIWGSTYLAIRFAIETLPPFVMMGTRFLVGGTFFYVWARLSGIPSPSRANWRATAVIGILMLCCATGTVGWAEQFVPSGLTALLIAAVPFWIVLVDWIRPGGIRPTRSMALGLIIGFIGIVLLVGPEEFGGGKRTSVIGATALVLACLSWAIGSVFSRRVKLPHSQQLAAGMEMLVAGVVLVAFGLITGESHRIVLADVSARSLLSLLYLIFFGSLGFVAYTWLLRASTPAKASTYAFVNPLVAVLLGATLGGEDFNLRIALAAIIIISAVIVITTARAHRTTVSEKPVPATAVQVEEAH